MDTGGLAQCYLRCGLRTKNISLTWEFVSHPWAPPAKSGVAKIRTRLEWAGGAAASLLCPHSVEREKVLVCPSFSLCKINLFGCSRSWSRHAGSSVFIVAGRMVFSATGGLCYGIWFRSQGANLSPLHWELRVLAARPQGKSLVSSLPCEDINPPVSPSSWLRLNGSPPTDLTSRRLHTEGWGFSLWIWGDSVHSRAAMKIPVCVFCDYIFT